jgi:hypothetical protein
MRFPRIVVPGIGDFDGATPLAREIRIFTFFDNARRGCPFRPIFDAEFSFSVHFDPRGMQAVEIVKIAKFAFPCRKRLFLRRFRR